MRAKQRTGGNFGDEWQLQEAKNRLSEVVRRAQEGGPQTITLHGRPAAVVVSWEAFRGMTRPAVPLSRFLAESPLAGLDLDGLRDADPGREVDL